MDIEPKHHSVIKYDYLNWFPSDNDNNYDEESEYKEEDDDYYDDN